MGSAVSNIVSVTVAQPTTATPTFSPAPGTYSVAQSVSILDTTPAAVIHYTTDGSTPTLASPVYSSPVTVASTETLKALAQAPGYLVSGIATGLYTIAAPTSFVINAGTFTDGSSGFSGLAFSGGVLDSDFIGSLVSGTAKTYTPTAFIRNALGAGNFYFAAAGAPTSLTFTLSFLDGAGNARTLLSSAAASVNAYTSPFGPGTYWVWPDGAIAAYPNGTQVTVTVT